MALFIQSSGEEGNEIVNILHMFSDWAHFITEAWDSGFCKAV